MPSSVPPVTRVPRLIVVNGPPAVGKSTLARRYVDEHPMALSVDLGSVRRLLGCWRDEPARAGSIARELSLVLARAHLAAGHDVVLPQYLGNPAFLVEAQDVARDTGAHFAEFVLMDDRETVVKRFAARTAGAATDDHVEAGELVARLGGDDALFAMYDRLLLVLSARPNAMLVQRAAGMQDEVYRTVIRHLEECA